MKLTRETRWWNFRFNLAYGIAKRLLPERMIRLQAKRRT